MGLYSLRWPPFVDNFLFPPSGLALVIIHIFCRIAWSGVFNNNPTERRSAGRSGVEELPPADMTEAASKKAFHTALGAGDPLV